MSIPGRLLDDEQRLDWLQLSRSENVGPVLFFQLVNRFGSAAAALEALPDISRRAGRREPVRIYPRERAMADMERADRIGARFVARGEAGYPPLLRHVAGPPPLLCIRGRAEVAMMPPLAIVGSRNASVPGLKLARRIAADVGRAGYAIVSGLARGIDTAAHEASLKTGTIAVLAGGIDHVYPRENARLMEEIAERGLLVTEMTPGTAPRAEFFPRRNRIVSGISFGVLVVEAAFRSGSLITARLAGEQGREVFAAPGSPMDPRAAGTNRLIRDGATMVTEAAHILEVLAPMTATPLPEAAPMRGPGNGLDEILSDATPSRDVPEDLYGRLLSLLGPVPATVDDLIRESGHPAADVLAALMDLELSGTIRRDPTGTLTLADA